jgi:hypothetical protein
LEVFNDIDSKSVSSDSCKKEASFAELVEDAIIKPISREEDGPQEEREKDIYIEESSNGIASNC